MKAGYLIVGALIFALAAAAVLIWTNQISLPGQPVAPPSASPPASTAAPPSAPAASELSDAKWMKQMSDIAAGGGIALTFADNTVDNWRIAAGHRLERFTVSGGHAVFARLSSGVPLTNEVPTWSERGLSFSLPMGFSNRMNGAQIEVGVVARKARANSAENLHVVYATQQAGNSGWQKLALEPEFSLLSFKYDVPAVAGGYSIPAIIVLHSDASGAGRAAEVLGVYVKVLKAPPS
jgi:hypothetical protein